MALADLPEVIRETYEVHEWKHASAVLKRDFPNEWDDIIAVLTGFRLRQSQVLAKGGRKSTIAESLDGGFYARGWQEKKWDTKIVIDESSAASPTHKVDCFKNRIALEVEWSNKDPFYDRDLNNFRLLFDLRVISVGVIITKSNDLIPVFKQMGNKVWAKYGQSTTWMGKLVPRILGGGGGGCPLLVFGITTKVYIPGE